MTSYIILWSLIYLGSFWDNLKPLLKHVCGHFTILVDFFKICLATSGGLLLAIRKQLPRTELRFVDWWRLAFQIQSRKTEWHPIENTIRTHLFSHSMRHRGVVLQQEPVDIPLALLCRHNRHSRHRRRALPSTLRKLLVPPLMCWAVPPPHGTAKTNSTQTNDGSLFKYNREKENHPKITPRKITVKVEVNVTVKVKVIVKVNVNVKVNAKVKVNVQATCKGKCKS